MNTIKALIIEDEIPAQELIKNFLSAAEDVELVGVADDGFEGLKAIQEQQPDLVFLDIQIPKLTGFEILELLDEQPVIVFSTAYDEYAINAFRANAADYLLKPYSKSRFDEALQRAREKLSQEQKPEQVMPALVPESIERIVVKTRHKLEIVKRTELIYLQADDDYVRIHTPRGEFMKNDTLKKYDGKLGKDFVRVHRSYIVNINAIVNISLMEKDSYELVLNNEHRIRASKSGYKSLKEVLGL